MALTIDLSDRVALVTGGGAGIGRGIALGLAGCGADVVIVDIDQERAQDAAGAVEKAGARALVVVADVMDSAQVRDAVEAADRAFGRLDVLVNNAGGVNGRPFLEQSERSWRRHIDINLVSALAATAIAAPLMIRGGAGGSIINVASIEGTRAAPMFAVYAACKAAMLSFTRTMAVELAEHGIRVNALTPDWTRTPGNSGMRSGPAPEALPPRPPEMQEALGRYIPLGREGTTDEIGAVAAFLASDLAGYVTGTVIPVDGGTWASSGWTRQGSGWTLFGATAMDGSA